MAEYNDLIFEISRPGRVGYSLPKSDVESIDLEDKFPKHLIRDEAAELPEVAELDLVRHYTALSNKNHGIDNGFYPLRFLYNEIQSKSKRSGGSSSRI